MGRVLVALACVACLASAQTALARELHGSPATYRELVRTLRPGDTLWLAAGTYREGLDLVGLVGAPAAPIAIRGASGAVRTIFVASGERNTVSIVDSAYVTLRDVDLLGQRMEVDAVKAEGTARFAHHITLQGLHISGYDGDQQNVAISTKCPAWDWIIRDNVIASAGTGLYLGNSDGSAPFVRGTIERNVVVGSIGYNLQVKHQNGRPGLRGMPDGRSDTVIRYNAFAKDMRSSAGGEARPNVLIGHLPLTGPGSHDRYLIYGNLFVDNPDEFLFQAEGNVVLYNNVFVNRCAGAIAIREHNDLPRDVTVFHNTVLAREIGLLLRHGDPAYTQRVAGNVIFAGQPVEGAPANGNLVGELAAATRYVKAPFARLAELDLTPRKATLGADASPEASELPDAALDVDGVARRTRVPGAYASSGPDHRRFVAIANNLLARYGAAPSGFVCAGR